MVEMTRMNLRVPDDVPGILAELAGGKNKMGDYLTTVIRQLRSGQNTVGKPGEIEMLAGSVMHLSAKQKEIDARLSQVEQQLSALIAERW